MFLKKTAAWLRGQSGLAFETTQIVEEAILLGNVTELDEVLELAEDQGNFPRELRYGLEALRHYRAHYGSGCELEPQDPLQKQKATVMEIAWSAELIDMLKQDHKIVAFKRA